MLLLLALTLLGVDPSTSGPRVRLLLDDGRFASIECVGDKCVVSTVAIAAPGQGGVHIDPTKAPAAARPQLEALARSLASRCELTTTASVDTWQRAADGSLSIDRLEKAGLPSGCAVRVQRRLSKAGAAWSYEESMEPGASCPNTKATRAKGSTGDVVGLPIPEGCKTLGVDMLMHLAQANAAAKP